jgi:sensor histidine kinase regulating citrate/malate metabolism
MKDRFPTGAAMVLGIAFLLIFGLVICSFCFHRLLQKPKVIPFEPVSIVFIIFALLTVSVLIILARNMFLLAKNEKILEIQNFYIEHLNEMVRVIRTERHDFVNHLQVVYALMRTGKGEKAQQYIEELCQHVRITGEMLSVDVPELSALLLSKEDLAATKKITFKIDINSDLIGLRIKPLDLITVVGNLLDNAFDAVEELPEEKREVVFKVSQTTKYFIFQTINPGNLPNELHDNIFQMGFSTKGGSNRGIGLASVKSVVEKNKGRVNVCNIQSGIKFTVLFPL